MTIRTLIARLSANEQLNYILTNHIPRSLLTRWLGKFSKIENPLVRAFSIGTWQLFSDLDLTEAREQHFKSMHACFTRELKAGARAVDQRTDVLCSPCDAIVGACGAVVDGMVIQAKGMPYPILDLLHDPSLVEHYRDGIYVTLRLTSSMYHRFHAPYDCTIDRVTYIAGDVWNVNPPALKRIDKLFCKNERAVLRTRLVSGHVVSMVPVAAVLVASIRLHFLNVLLHLKYKGPNVVPCHHAAKKGEELGWFEHGSTIILFAPKGLALCEAVREGEQIKMGQALMHLPT
jgi:phosphatidylserine decarboxylase